MREALIQARNAKGLTQKQLATAANISTRQYRKIEADKAKPNVETAISIAKFLGYGVTDLFSPAAATAEDTTYPDYSSSGRSGIAEAKELSEENSERK